MIVKPTRTSGMTPEGKRVSLADLPCVRTGRWVTTKKGPLVDVIRAGLIGVDEVCRRYGLEAIEVERWVRSVVRPPRSRARSGRTPAPGVAESR